MDDKLYECDGNFNISNCLDYTLLLEIGANYYSYAIVDDQEKLRAICQNNSSIFTQMADSDLLKSTYKHSKISLNTQNFTFIPSHFYSQNQQIEYHQFLDNTLTNNLFTHTILNNEITVLNTYSTDSLNLVKQNFPSANIYPLYIPFLESTFKQFKGISGVQLFLNIKPESLELLIIQDGSLQFYNIFKCSNDDEMLYYIMLACKKNNILPKQVTMRVCGNLTQTSVFYHQLNTIFADIRLTKTNAIYVNNAEFNTIEAHNFFSLLSLIICE